MPSIKNTRTFSMGNRTFSSDPEVTAIEYDHENIFELVPNLAYTLTGWVKTDNDTGAGDMAAGHGQTNGTYDAYWTESGVNKKRTGLTGTITTNNIVLDGGAGDNFPATATSGITVCKQKDCVAYIDGDRIQGIGIFLKNDADVDAVGRIDLQDAGNASIETLALAAGGLDKMDNITDVVNGDTNIYTGNVITHVIISQSSPTDAGKVYILSGETTA